MTYQEYFETYCNYYKELQKKLVEPKCFTVIYAMGKFEHQELIKHVKKIGEIKTILNSYARYTHSKNSGSFCACCIKRKCGEWGCIVNDKDDRSCPATVLCEHNISYHDMPVDARYLWNSLSDIEIRNMVLSKLRKNGVIAWKWLP